MYIPRPRIRGTDEQPLSRDITSNLLQIDKDSLEDMTIVCCSDKSGNVKQYYYSKSEKLYYKEETVRFDGSSELSRMELFQKWLNDKPDNIIVARIDTVMEWKRGHDKPWHSMSVGYIDANSAIQNF